MNKIVYHYFDYNTQKGMPQELMDAYRKQGEAGAKCGYRRKNTTTNTEMVTCKLCLRKMNTCQLNKKCI